MRDPFVFNGIPAQTIFGRGALAQLSGEVDRLGLQRVIVLATPGHQDKAEQLARMLGSRSAGVFAGARMHTPIEVTAEAMAIVRESRVDGLLALGGGSTIGLGKAIAFRTDLPQIVVPTTYSGSEMTDILGETGDGQKTTKRDPKIRPEVVIYDVDLTLSLPPRLSATSGVNAIAHAVEGLYAPDRNPIVTLMAQDGIAALGRALPTLMADPADGEARADALYGAWLCGVTLGSVAMGLHHKLCHVLGGTFGLPHSETHAVVLPHATAYNAAAVPELLAPVTQILGGDGPGAALFDLNVRIGAPLALKDIGMPESGLDQAADIAVQNTYSNVRPLVREEIGALLDDAFHGRRPERR